MLRLSIKRTEGVTMSRKIILSLCLLASFFMLSAVTLDGIVINGADANPVPGALIELHQGQNVDLETETDENGQFEFADLEPGNYMLHVEADSFDPYMEMIELEDNVTITIELTQGNNPGEFTGHLFGIVSYENGEPAAGLEMVINTWNQNTQPHHVSYETILGEDGSYDFNEILDNSDYNIMVMNSVTPFETEVYVEGETEFNFTLEDYEPGETYTLGGTVTDSETGDVLAGIEVILHGMQGMVQEAITDDSGYYMFSEVLEGTYNLTVPAYNNGYEMFQAEVEITEDTVFDITLVPAEQGEFSLSGTVTDAETNEPLSGIVINLYAGPGMHYDTTSAEDGTYLIEGLFEGIYALNAMDEEMEYSHFQTEVEIVENTVLDIQLQPYATGDLVLSGTVTSEETGDPLPEIMVHLFGENIPGSMYTAVSDENGYYEIGNIAAGNYQLMVMGMHGTVLFEQDLEILEDMTFDIVIGENHGGEGSLSGFVMNAETGDVISGVQIYLQHGWETYETVSGEDGSFLFENINNGNYRVIAGMDGYDQFNEMVEIDGDVVLEINLVPYETGDFTLSGTVTDSETGDVISGIHIQLYGQQSHPGNAVTDEAGYYEISGLYEGTYQLMAWSNGWTEYEPFDATIDIAEDMVFDFELIPFNLPGTGSISGTIYDIDSSLPTPGAIITFASIDGSHHGSNWAYYSAVTDEFGDFLIDNVEAGEYILSAVADGYLESYYDGVTNPEDATVISIDEEIQIEIEMSLTPLVFYTVSGNVMDFANETPIAGADVMAMLPGTGCNHWAVVVSVTDDDGNYTLEVPQGDYIFAAEFDDPVNNSMLRQFYDHKQSPANADIVTVAEDITGIDFDLATQEVYDNSIAGSITINDSIPENPVLVAAVAGGGNHWEAACVTDMFGNYLLENLPEGDYYILAYEYNSVPTYYPGVIDFQDAESVNALGAVTDIDFDLIVPEENGVYRADGYVVDHNNDPVANANVVIMDDLGTVLGYAVTNSAGYYLVEGLPAGDLTGLATKVLYQSDEETLNMTTTGSADFVIIPEGTTDSPEDNITPAAVSLSNYPNPFNPVTTISFGLPEAGYTTLSIYNIAGQKIATLVQDELTAGIHNITWNGTSQSGTNVASGMYFYRLQFGDSTMTQKMVLMK